MDHSIEEFERALAWVQDALWARDDRLREELASSARDYFGPWREGAGRSDALAARRHLEWFLFEQVSATLEGVPLEVFVNRGGEDVDEADLEEHGPVLAAMLASLASVFEVTGVASGEGVWVRDLAGGGEYALAEPEASLALEAGDLLVGRLYGVGQLSQRMSSAAGFFRDERLRRAVESDLERARSARRGSLRLSQAELEKMFWGDADAAGSTPAADGRAAPDRELSLARARALLIEGGVDSERVEDLFESLAQEPLRSESVVPGVDDALAHVLEELAFETDIDMERARAALLDAWVALSLPREAKRSATGAATQAAPRPSARDAQVDVHAAVAAFEQGRSEGRDLGELFADLERDLGLEDDEESAEEDLAPDFPGVVGAMVEEYLWDRGREFGPEAAAAHAVLRKFSEYGTSIGVFENIGRREMLVFGAVWVPELGGLAGAEEARALMLALRSFCAWCDEQHALPLAAEFAAGPAGLIESLPRAVAANRAREGGADLDAGSLFEVARNDADAFVVRDAQGSEFEARAPREVREHLRPGDRLRADLKASQAGAHSARILRVYCCYPPESALIEAREAPSESAE